MKNYSAGNDYKKTIDQNLVDYLASLGFHPSKIRRHDYWYLSPLRNEKTPSFKINNKLNIWYDFGLGKGGNLIDFATRFKNCTVGDFFKSLKDISTTSYNHPHQKNSSNFKEASAIQITSIKPLHTLALLTYLKSRNIPITVADKYCVEIGYKVNAKNYYSIGFKNDLGGYELRNPYCKNCSSPKGITTIKNGAEKLAIFEGFFNFLSFIYLLPDPLNIAYDFCILNSLSFFEKTIDFLSSYETIHLFLDNDDAGQKCSSVLLQTDNKFIDESDIYKNYKDLNEWVKYMGKTPLKLHLQIPPNPWSLKQKI